MKHRPSSRPRSDKHPPFSHAAHRPPLTPLACGQVHGRFTKQGPGQPELAREPRDVNGIGHHAHCSLRAAEDQLFELPLTWFTDRKTRDFSPGYEAMADPPDFFRVVSVEGLDGHSDPEPPRRGSRTRFEAFPAGPVGCSRCHGGGHAHAEARLVGMDAERAEAWLTRGLAALPDRTDGWVELAALRRLRGDSAGEAAAAEKAFALQADDRRLATTVGAARLASGHVEEALEALERALQTLRGGWRWGC